MLWLRPNPRPLHPTNMGGPQEEKWSRICFNSKHKGESLVFIPYKPSLTNQTVFCLGSCDIEFKSAIPKGIITSPSYPDMYASNQDCIYTISQNAGFYISLHVHTFHLLIPKEGTKCYSTRIRDFIEIRDGNSSDSELIGKFCDTNIPATIQSTNNNLWIRWME